MLTKILCLLLLFDKLSIMLSYSLEFEIGIGLEDQAERYRFPVRRAGIKKARVKLD